jgi:hypothetical protein
MLVKYQDFKANKNERGSGEPARFTVKPLNIEKVMPTIEIVEDKMENLNKD